MGRRMGVVKRAPAIEREALSGAHRLSKADWIEVYRDLWVQCYGEDTHQADPTGWLKDAVNRRALIK